MRGPRILAVSLGAALAVGAVVRDAAAEEFLVGVEGRGELMHRFGKTLYGGPGLALEAGYGFFPTPLVVVPEIVLAGSVYPPDTLTSGSFRAMAGLRVGVALEFEPAVYVRGGYCGLFGRVEDDHGGTLEAGVSLDKRWGRLLTFGGFVGYQGFYIPRWANGVSGGVHWGFWIR